MVDPEQMAVDQVSAIAHSGRPAHERAVDGCISREQFIAAHLVVCRAGRCGKYDAAKAGGGGAHTLEYSRRKCAKALWRRYRSCR